MGYNLYITRGNWFDQNKPKIGAEEWISLVQADPELALEMDDTSGQSPGLALNSDSDVLARWPASDEDPFFIYSHRSGTIRVKSPGDQTIRKMIQIADELDAFVQGEEDEYYRLSDTGVERYDGQ